MSYVRTNLVFAITAAMFLSVTASATEADNGASDIQEVRALFLRQAAEETAGRIDGIDAVLARTPAGQHDPVSFVARAYRYWGRDEVLAHFRKIFTGTWRFEPDETQVRVTLLGKDVAEIFAPTRVTVGPAGQPAVTSKFYVTEFALRTSDGWRISSIVAVPAQ